MLRLVAIMQKMLLSAIGIIAFKQSMALNTTEYYSNEMVE